MMVEKDRCMYCGCCACVCPFNAVFVTEDGVYVNEDCTDCKTCVKACPMGAIS